MTRAFQPGLFGGPAEMPERPEPAPARVPPVSSIVYETLDLEEQDRVYRVAARVARRYEEGKDERGRRAVMKFVQPGRSIEDVVVQGLGAELAVASYLGLPWNEGKRTKADVGHNVEVRQTRYEDGLLVLKSFDHLERVFILAVGHFPTYRLAGWIRGYTGTAAGVPFAPGEKIAFRLGGPAWASSNGGWTVPQAALAPMSAVTVRR